MSLNLHKKGFIFIQNGKPKKCKGCKKIINAKGKPNKSGLCSSCWREKYA